jgi:peptide deformylase
MPLKIAQLGQPVLWQVAQAVPLEEIASEAFQSFLKDMLATLRLHEGAGLAAPQVYSSRRVFLAAIMPAPDDDAPPEVEVFINPRLTQITEEQIESWEGCLSFPELVVKVPRFTQIRVDYLNAQGKPAALRLEGFPARVIQHEYDHLEGILTLDRMASPRDIIKTSEADEILKKKTS